VIASLTTPKDVSKSSSTLTLTEDNNTDTVSVAGSVAGTVTSDAAVSGSLVSDMADSKKGIRFFAAAAPSIVDADVNVSTDAISTPLMSSGKSGTTTKELHEISTANLLPSSDEKDEEKSSSKEEKETEKEKEKEYENENENEKEKEEEEEKEKEKDKEKKDKKDKKPSRSRYEGSVERRLRTAHSFEFGDPDNYPDEDTLSAHSRGR